MESQPARENSRGARNSSAPIEERLADEARFFRSWLENPAIAGAVSPSGRALARVMARYVDPRKAGPVVELGPGTGSITEALLERGVEPKRLFLVEFDRSFCKLLRRRFPGVHIIHGDAYELAQALRARLRKPASAIVSSLPLLLKPEERRLALLDGAFRCLEPDGCFIQFTYSPLPPINREKVAALSLRTEASLPVWLNLPPARVWIYRRRGAEEAQFERKRPSPSLELFFDKLRSGLEGRPPRHVRNGRPSESGGKDSRNAQPDRSMRHQG